MATVPEIPVIHVPGIERDVPDTSRLDPSVGIWAPLEVPRDRRPSPAMLAILGVLAGIGAMALGTVAVFAAGASADGERAVSTTRVVSAAPGVEQRVLTLLAKPSTERIVFRGSGGRLVLAVGSGGRAAILLHGLERAAVGKPYYAWAVVPGRASVRAARFVGTERAAFLSERLGPKASVIVSTDRPIAGRSSQARLIAIRG